MSLASASVKINFADNCDCNCDCFPWRQKDPQLYINHDGEAEKFDKSKAQGDENKKSIERLEVVLEERLRRHSEEVGMLKVKIQEMADLNFELMKKKDIKITKSRLDRINDAISKVLETI